MARHQTAAKRRRGGERMQDDVRSAIRAGTAWLWTGVIAAWLGIAGTVVAGWYVWRLLGEIKQMGVG